MVDHRHLQFVLCPRESIRIGPLAGEEKRAKCRQVVVLDQRSGGVVPLDGPKRRRCREQTRDRVLRRDPPVDAGVGGSDRFAFEQNRRASMNERAVHDVRMADHPADVRRRPEHLARLHAVDVLHRPVERDEVSPVVAHDALGLPGRSGRVQDVERIGRRNRDAVVPLRAREGVVPFDIASRDQIGGGHRPLIDDAV